MYPSKALSCRFTDPIYQYCMQVYMDLDTLKKFVISYHNDYNYDMTEDWEYDWTFPKAFLFTVTIMTTIGKHMQSFGWINHQSLATQKMKNHFDYLRSSKNQTAQCTFDAC